jgi:uncharacterized membrane protein (Fun14 family)
MLCNGCDVHLLHAGSSAEVGVRNCFLASPGTDTIGTLERFCSEWVMGGHVAFAIKEVGKVVLVTLHYITLNYISVIWLCMHGSVPLD